MTDARGSFLIAWPLLVEVMHMPADTELRFVEMAGPDMIRLTVSHPDIPASEDGAIVELDPSVTKETFRWEWGAPRD